MSRPVDMTWMDGAPCVGKGRLFFAPEGERPADRAVRVAAAKAVCRTCPLIVKCGKAAEERGEASGVWAAVDRDSHRVKSNPSPRGPGRKPLDHGTRQGAAGHYRRGEAPCDACREAHTFAEQYRRSVRGRPRRGAAWEFMGPARYRAYRYSLSLRQIESARETAS